MEGGPTGRGGPPSIGGGRASKATFVLTLQVVTNCQQWEARPPPTEGGPPRPVCTPSMEGAPPCTVCRDQFPRRY